MKDEFYTRLSDQQLMYEISLIPKYPTPSELRYYRHYSSAQGLTDLLEEAWQRNLIDGEFYDTIVGLYGKVTDT